jgi:peptidoglycan/LPS O-acetylase OafA/YrhL
LWRDGILAEARQNLATVRNTQLDGWRAFAVLGVMWHHWSQPSWRGDFPFEIGLFFFLTLTGFLITRILLRERQRGENEAGRWRWRAYFQFQKQRLNRILIPCYAAMVFALLVGASDIHHHPAWYFLHGSNFHMALRTSWPSGTAHFWTLALQVQFYLVWPWVVFITPQRALAQVFCSIALLAPLSRWIIAGHFPRLIHGEAITTSALDYFAIGALLSLALERGLPLQDRRIKFAAALAFIGYLILYCRQQSGHPIAGFCVIQQTLLAIVFAGLIAITLAGFKGILAAVLEHPISQHLGRLSFGFYLFHVPAPLLLGWILPQLWAPWVSGPWLILRLLAFALSSWGLAFLCWRYLERPARAVSPHAAAGSPDR